MLIAAVVGHQVDQDPQAHLVRPALIDNDGPGLLRLDEELGQRPAGTTEATPA